MASDDELIPIRADEGLDAGRLEAYLRGRLPGAAGVSPDFALAAAWANSRTLRLADGPDAVHNRAIARHELAKYQG